MNKILNDLLRYKGKCLINLRSSNIQILKNVYNLKYFILIYEKGEYEIFYITQYIRKSKKYLSNNYIIENIIDKSKIKIKSYSPNIIFFTKL